MGNGADIPIDQAAAAQRVDAATGCHIVRRRWSDDFAKEVVLDCRTLSAEALCAIEPRVPRWRDFKYVAADLISYARQTELAGIALVEWTKKRPIDLPPPLRVPFEPLELDETAERLLDLLEQAGVDAADPRLSRGYGPTRRFFARLGVFNITLITLLFQAVFQVVLFRDRFVFIMWGAIFGVVLLAGLITRFFSSQWLIVPGGVIVRRGRVFHAATSAILYQPRNAVLYVCPEPGSYLAVLHTPKRRPSSRRLTAIELQALLAAWQSPLEPLSTERMSDFAG